MAEQVLDAAVAPVAKSLSDEMLRSLVDENEADNPGESDPTPPEATATDPTPAAVPAPTPPPAAAASPADPTPAAAAASSSTPGTPDKAIQKLQQDLGVALRQQSEILARLETKPPTAADNAAAQKAQRTIDQLRAQIAEPDFDPNLVDSAVLVKSLLEADASAAANAQTLAQINARLAELNQQTAADRERAANPGIDVQAEWDKAVEAAKPYARFGGDAWQQRTQELYDQQLATLKAAAPTKTPAGSAPAATPPATPAGSRVGPIVTSGGARLDAPTGAGIVVQQHASEQQGYEKLLDKLWK